MKNAVFISSFFLKKMLYYLLSFCHTYLCPIDKTSEKETSRCSISLNHIKKYLILVSAITGCISISAFALLVGILISIASSAV